MSEAQYILVKQGVNDVYSVTRPLAYLGRFLVVSLPSEEGRRAGGRTVRSPVVRYSFHTITRLTPDLPFI